MGGKEGEKLEEEGRRDDEGGVGVGECAEGDGVGDELLLEHRGCYRKLNVMR